MRFFCKSVSVSMVEEGTGRALQYRWFIFWIFSIQFLLLFFHRICPAILAPEFVTAFSISGVGLGVLSSAYFYPYAFMQIPIGILSDSWGVRKTATLFGLIACLGVMLFAFSHTIGFATFSRVLLGLGVSATFVCGMKVFTEWFKKVEYARISGLFISVGSVGWLIGTTPLAMLSQKFDWREIFIIIGLIMIALTLLTWLLVVDSPEKKGIHNVQEQKVIPISKRKLIDDIQLVFREKYFWPLAIWFFFRVAILFSFFGLWAGPYLMDTYKLSKIETGNILLMVPLAIIVGSPFLGYLSDKILVSRKQVIVGSSVVHSLCWLILLVFHGSLSIPALYLLFFITGAASSAPGSVGFTATKELFSATIAGTSIGAANLFSFLGGMIFQPVIGYVLDKAGKVQGVYPPSAYKLAFWIFFITSLMSLLGALLSKETISRDKR